MNKIFLLIAFLFSSTFSISSFTYPWIINLTGDTATVVKWKSNNDTVKAFCDRAADTITNNSARLDTLEDTIAVHSLKIDSLQDTSSLQSARIDTLEDTVAVHSTHLDALDDSTDNRYTKSASDDRYVNEAGDTMTGPLVIEAGSPGTVTASPTANQVVIKNSTTAGMSVLTPDANTSYVVLGSQSDSTGAYFRWNYAALEARLTSATAGAKLRLGAGDQVDELVLYPDSVVATSRITSPIIGDTVVDYAATSTVTGWSSFTTKEILYQKTGKKVTVWFNIRGTSNSTSTIFTLPDAASSASGMDFVCSTNNNGTRTIGEGSVSGNNVIVFPDATSSWIGSGTKYIYGQFTYFID